jgi:hypothetical protein
MCDWSCDFLGSPEEVLVDRHASRLVEGEGEPAIPPRRHPSRSHQGGSLSRTASRRLDRVGGDVVCVGGVGMGGSVWGLRIVGGAVKEGEGGNVTIYREDFGEKVGGVPTHHLSFTTLLCLPFIFPLTMCIAYNKPLRTLVFFHLYAGNPTHLPTPAPLLDVGL